MPLPDELVIKIPAKETTMKCFKCEKEMEWLDASNRLINDGGELTVDFGYGSVYDQIGQKVSKDAPRAERLQSCSKIQGYICDSCFEKHAELFEGYKEIKQHSKFIREV